MANNKEYLNKRKSLKEHYSNRILAVFTLGIFNFILLFYLYRMAMGQLGIFLLTHHETVYFVLAGCSLVVAAVLFFLWQKDDQTRPFYKENYRYFWIYFAAAAAALALISPVGRALGSVQAWMKWYMAANILYVVASIVYYSVISNLRVGKIKKQ